MCSVRNDHPEPSRGHLHELRLQRNPHLSHLAAPASQSMSLRRPSLLSQRIAGLPCFAFMRGGIWGCYKSTVLTFLFSRDAHVAVSTKNGVVCRHRKLQYNETDKQMKLNILEV